jgi:hypothetical protein
MVCTQCYEEITDVKTRSLLNFIIQILVVIAIIGAIVAIMMVNNSFAQSDEEFRIANTQYDSIGSLYCCNEHPWPCTEPFEPKLTIIGWDLRVHEWLVVDTYTERAWAFKLYWVPRYKGN